MNLPDKQYNIIYCDPPWEYQDKALAGERGAGCKYDVMSIDDICKIPVPTICADDCLMFMWVTMPQMQEGLVLMRVWGFTYKTVAFTWVKTNPKTPTLFWGMGRWTRANPEVVFLGTKGHPKRIATDVHSVVETDTLYSPIGAHSEKPNEVRQRIVELVGDIPRIELFARKRYIGWDTWGNQVNDFYEDAGGLF